ncbi:hypothetical protein GYMLUDRAFT_50405 [Collybiopsis luxurians FD-317 M1]|uniref:Piwi domain-containing protein n=1 Tax=Collybiopsis luxurians FD-317 M1 TaxID=944289 RepID=A0A0D0AN72_9AGAR|nr:hypothetical protein GYMLUDRAFT_50405 [Collybiopsis luxurians FD-317 M1]
MNPHARHPRYGNEGRLMAVDVNAFALSWREKSVVLHYDGAIKPEFAGPGGREITLGGEKGSEIIQRLQAKIRPDMFPTPGAFDGKKNLYATRKFNFSSQVFTVPWEKNQIHSTGKTVEVTIVHVRTVDISILHRLLSGAEQGNPSAIGPGTNVASSLNMLQVFLQATPRMAEGNLHKGKSVYVQWHKHFQQSHFQKKIDDKMQPLRLLDGLFQSVRPTIGNLLVNIDLTVGVILPKMSLEELCGRSIGARDARELRNVSPRNFDKLRHLLRDVKITIEIPHQRAKTKARRIRGLIQDVGAQRFDKQGFSVTVAEHFKEAHEKVIPPKTLGVLVGQHEMFPISYCNVPEQLYKSKLQPEQVREVLSFVPQNPRERLNRIQAGWQNLEYRNSQFLAGAQIHINPEPLAVEGRVLPSPSICYGPQQRPDMVNLERKPGTWDVMRRTFWLPFPIPYVMFLNLTGLPSSSEMKEFRESLLHIMNDRAIPVGGASPIVDDNGADLIKSIPYHGQRLGAPKDLLLVAILQESAGELYANVKRAGDIVHGIASQCVKWSSKLIQTIRNKRGFDQYLNNLVLKINARCGGINHVPSSPAMQYLSKRATMIIGADVSHPSPGSKAPSFASLVSSHEQFCARYTGQISMQSSRQEIIQSLRQMMDNALNLFFSENNGLERIFFFRDGVSEGEFETVRIHELHEIKDMLDKKFYPNPRPKITFIVVGKRHHFRFFPRGRGDADQSGNCPSGFVVDRGIEHPVYSDFYLQSQPGLKGTSIPAHYTVIEDENLSGEGDKLQAIAYALCHTYQRSTRSVKIPAPVYYADLVCRRAKFHFSPQYSNQLEGLSDAASNEQPAMENDFQALHPDLRKKMHFM